MARFVADENFPLPVVEALRAAGHDVRTLQELGESALSMPDDEVLARATAERRAVLTLNRRDFFRLHRANPGHGGISACTLDLDFTRQAARIDEVVRAHESLAGVVVRVNRPDR